MNEVVIPRVSSATLAVIGITAMMAAGQTAWPDHEAPPYITTHNTPTANTPWQTPAFVRSAPEQAFGQDIALIYASLSQHQAPLGVEFEKIWDKNVHHLYES